MSKRIHKITILFAVIIIISTFFTLLFYGLDYYFIPLKDKFYHVNHKLLKSSGLLGHGFGIVGAAILLFGVIIYMVRKRVKRFYKLGKLKYWLEFHIFLATLGPILILFHTAFRFGGIVSVSFWSMVIVVLSGVVGRYIYQLIPHNIEGHELSHSEISKLDFSIKIELQEKYQLENEILDKLEEASNIDREIRISELLGYIVRDSLKKRKQLSEIKKQLQLKRITRKDKKNILKLLKSKLLLSRKIVLLKTTQKLFGYWHVAHLPFAIIMLVIMIVHVVIALTFGYQWVF